MKQLNENKMNIQCEWMQSQRVLINPDGQVLPCCFFANVIYMMTKTDEEKMVPKAREDRGIEDQIMDHGLVALETKAEKLFQEYLDNKDAYNINKTPIEDIISSEWFVKSLPESWDDENKAVRQCKKYCTKK